MSVNQKFLPRLEHILRFAISLFIIFNIYAAAVMAFPKSWSYRETLLSPIYPILIVLGIYHYLPLFSPNPSLSDCHIDFVVEFDNGQLLYWKYPRSKLAFWDPPGSFQRFVQEFFWWQGSRHTEFFPTFARYIAKHTSSALRHPVRIMYEISECSTPSLEVVKGQNKSTDIRKFTLYSYHVSANDL